MGTNIQTNTTETPQKTPVKSIIIGAAIMAGIIVLTLFVVFRQVTPAQMFEAMKQMKPVFILLGLLAMFGYTFGEGMTISRALKMLGYPVNIWKGIKYGIVGLFYSSITPSASGGQPMQIYYMYRDKIKVTHGFMAIMVLFFGFEAATVGLAIAGFISQGRLLSEAMGGTKMLLTIGIFVNLFLLVLVSLILFSENAIHAIGRFAVRVIGIFEKKQDKIKNAVSGAIAEYASCSGALKGHRDVVIKTLLTSVFQFICMYSVPWLVYRGFGLSEYGWVQAFFLQAVLYVGVGFLPLPGAAGVSEATFMIIFRILYPQAILASAMVMTRCINLYFILIIYGIAVLFFTRRLLKRGPEPENGIEEG